MKKFLYACIILSSFSCSSSIKENKVVVNEPSKKYLDVSKEYFGFWVSEDYITTIKETKSTKKASDSGVDEFIVLTAPNSIVYMSVHDGGANNRLLMTSTYKGEIVSPDSTILFNSVEFKNDYLIIDSKKFFKAPNGLDALVNEMLLSGDYTVNNEKFNIDINGTITGLDSITFCKLNLDYNDAGMQYDKIDFQFKNEKDPRTFIYEFSVDTLIISNIVCLAYEAENDFCLEIEKGTTVYKIVKNR